MQNAIFPGEEIILLPGEPKLEIAGGQHRILTTVGLGDHRLCTNSVLLVNSQRTFMLD